MRTVAILFAASLAALTPAMAASIDWKNIDAALGREAAVTGDVHRYGFPRNDLRVTLDGITIEPGLALGGWVAFKPEGDQAMVMGDLVLLESEINPVMSKLLEGGLSVTAVHNHLLRANPQTFYLHVAAHGDPDKIAASLREALAVSKTPLTAPAASAATNVPLDTADLDRIIGVKGKAAGDIYQFAVQRIAPVNMGGMPLTPPAPLGVATGINFQPLGNGKAATTGDFVLIGNEVEQVAKALRSSGIEVTAIHSHMLDEQPRLFFLHFWGVGETAKLATGLRAALANTSSVVAPNRE